MDRVDLIIKAGKISSRIKFFLQDVVELRNVCSVSVSVCVHADVYVTCSVDYTLTSHHNSNITDVTSNNQPS